jgi:hypothetical protein
MEGVAVLQPAQPAQPVWRVPRPIRRSAVAAGLVFVVVAVGATAIGLDAGGAVALWVISVVVLLCAWRWYLVPYVALTSDRLVVQGVFTHRSVCYSSIREVRPGLYGLRIKTKAQESFIGWAVQKSTFSEWSHRAATADEVVAEIMERVHDSSSRSRRRR